MPGYRLHLFCGLLTYLAILQCMQYQAINFSIIIQGLIFCLLGALFPDIDIKSKGQKLYYSIFFVLLLWLLYQHQFCLFAVMSLLGIIPILVRHRGIFHHFWFLLIMVLMMIGAIKIWCGSYATLLISNCWFFFVGSVSHVVLDRTVSWFKKTLNR